MASGTCILPYLQLYTVRNNYLYVQPILYTFNRLCSEEMVLKPEQKASVKHLHEDKGSFTGCLQALESHNLCYDTCEAICENCRSMVEVTNTGVRRTKEEARKAVLGDFV